MTLKRKTPLQALKVRKNHFLKFITFTFTLYCCAFYLPLSSKSLNNLFYLGVAFPTFIFLICQTKDTLILIKRSYAILLLILLFIATNTDDSGDLKIFIYLSLLYCCLYNLKAENQQPFLYFSILNTIFFLGILLDWMFNGLSTGTWPRYRHLFGQYINPVYTATIITSSLTYIWLFKIDAPLSKKGKGFHAIGFAAFCLIATLCATVFQARSALLGFGIFVGGYILSRRLYWLAISIVVVALAFLIPDTTRLLLLERGFSYRPQIWIEAFQRVTEICGIWTGCGSDEYLFGGMWPHAHSAYMSALYKNGIPGLAALLAIIAYTVLKAHHTRWLLISLVGWGSLLTTTAGVLSSPHQLFWLYFWMPTFLACVESKTQKASTPHKPSDLVSNQEAQ